MYPKGPSWSRAGRRALKERRNGDQFLPGDEQAGCAGSGTYGRIFEQYQNVMC